jgi:hypothetical protein
MTPQHVAVDANYSIYRHLCCARSRQSVRGSIVEAQPGAGVELNHPSVWSALTTPIEAGGVGAGRKNGRARRPRLADANITTNSFGN